MSNFHPFKIVGCDSETLENSNEITQGQRVNIYSAKSIDFKHSKYWAL